MKKLALLFVGLIGCAHAPVVLIPADSVEVTVRQGMTWVDYRTSLPSDLTLTSKGGTKLALRLQEIAIRKSVEFCETLGKTVYPLSSSAKQDKGELSGHIVVVCIPKSEQEDTQEK